MSVKITCIYANNFQVREIYSNMLGDIYTYNHQITCVYANNVTLAQLTTTDGNSEINKYRIYAIARKANFDTKGMTYVIVKTT